MKYLLRFLTWRRRRNQLAAARCWNWTLRLVALHHKSKARSQAHSPARALPPTRARHLIAGDGA